MKNIIFLILFIPFLFISYSCEVKSTTEPIYNDTTSAVDRKPNLYIYPNQTLTLSVEILFPNGGKILESIPEYQNSWNVIVNPNGKINDTYDYLFYECKMANLTQKEYGWVIERTNLKDFFIENLTTSGFNKNETNDFVEYWLPLLTDYKYFEIYPQYKSTLDEMVKINFSIEPEYFYRLHYLIKGRNNNQVDLVKPNIENAKRENYFAVEWGVILK